MSVAVTTLLESSAHPGAPEREIDYRRVAALAEVPKIVANNNARAKAKRAGARALRESLDGIALGDGGTLIVDPNGVVLAEAAPKTEEIVYADLDLGVALAARTLRDQGGHYHRPDLLELRIDGRRLG